MSFKDLDIQPEYRNLSLNIIDAFYVPVLSTSKVYQRAVGFFSSTALIELSKGITQLIKNNGKIQIVASPRLSEDDINAINQGIQLRDELIVKRLKSELIDTTNIFEEERLNLICNLIANGYLEIRIAFMQNNKNEICMYHEKMGLMTDEDNNTIAFTGSMNETATAFKYNYETIEVYKSWSSDQDRVICKKRAFTDIWNNNEPFINVQRFEEIEEEIIKKYKKNSEINLEIDCPIKKDTLAKDTNELIGPIIPQDIILYDYQIQAINNWRDNDYRGIFDMATGTGKTYTGLGAISTLYQEKKTLAVIIVCPFKHLVTQWVDDIRKFNMNPIIGHSSSPQKEWYSILSRKINSFNLNIENNFCFITTNATFMSTKVQNLIKLLTKDTILLIDEAHNFGSEKLSQCLLLNIPYRLALSATLERHQDSVGTEKLIQYFDKKCIEYNLEDAIKAGKLTPYKYYPIIVTLTELEQEKYLELTKKIIRCSTKNRDGTVTVNESGKLLLIERARVVAGANNKILALKNIIKDYTEKSHMLIYCGATTLNETDDEIINETDEKQIDIVVRLLGKEFGMKVAKFTSMENMIRRKQIKDDLAEGEILQAVIAIKCLDEGVDIPSIQTAFILASSTNPKEYIQRRGRVLRKFPGKKYAEIYDFITLPYYEDEFNAEATQSFKGLATRELRRVEDFSSLAINSSFADEIIFNIKRLYSIIDSGSDNNATII